MNQENLEKEIVRWVHYDNKLKEYNEKSKKIREEKSRIGDLILHSIPTDSDSLPQFTIDALNANVSCHYQQKQEGLTYKFLQTCFDSYFNSKETSQDLLEFIKSKRSSEQTLSLKRETLS